MATQVTVITGEGSTTYSVSTGARGPSGTGGATLAPDMLDRYFRYANGTEIAHGSTPEAGDPYRLSIKGDIFHVDTINNVCALKNPLIAGTAQVETATAAGTVAVGGNAIVTVTSPGMAGSPLTISVAVTNTDTSTVWAGKVRAALTANATIAARFTVGGAGTAISLTRLPATVVNGVSYFSSNDSALNIALATGTATGINAAATSANTTIGVATSNFGFVDGQRVMVKVGSGLPSPLVENTLYYIVNATEFTFKLASTAGGTAIVLSTAGTNPSIAGLPFIAEGALVAQSSSLYYLGGITNENVRNITMELSLNAVTNLQAGVVIPAGLTIALAPTELITDSNGIQLPSGTLHIQIKNGVIIFGIGTGGANFTDYLPLNSNVEGGNGINLPQDFNYGKRFIVRFEFSGDECRISVGGGSYVYKHQLIAAAAGKNWWVETTGDYGSRNTNFFKIYRLSVNSETLEDQPSWSVQPKSQLLTDLTMGGPVTMPQVLRVLGGAYASTISPPNSFGLRVAGNTYTEGKFLATPFGAGWVIESAAFTGEYLTSEYTSTTTQTLATTFVTLYTKPLLQIGDSQTTIVRGDFPTTNFKTVAVDVTGAPVFTTGAIADLGPWELTITRVFLSSSFTNQLHFKFESTTTRLLAFYNGNGNNNCRIRCLAPTANGDVKVRAAYGNYLIRY